MIPYACQCNRYYHCRLTKQAGKAIEAMDAKYGMNRPIVVIGYNCIGRCTSIRSKHRVINYIIAGYQKGKTCADLKQMLMRGAGGGTRAVSHFIVCWLHIYVCSVSLISGCGCG